MPGSERDGKFDPAGLRFQPPAAPRGYTVTTIIEIQDDAEGQPPGQDQATGNRRPYKSNCLMHGEVPFVDTGEEALPPPVLER